MEKKMTKKMVITEMLANEVILANANWVAYLSNELSLVTKKAESKKVSETQKLNAQLRNLIVELISNTETQRATIAQLQEMDESLAECNNQKMSALLSPLCKDGTLERVKEKKLTYYQLVEVAEEETDESEETE